jgi:hypothetical protein
MNIVRLNEDEIDGLLEKENIDLSSFRTKNILNPKIFDKNNQMKPEVRTRLLMIADDFYESLEIDWVDIDDIILTGSLANYNWSKFSDVDLHITLDFGDVDDNEDLVREYFTSKKDNWNEKHDITIRGYDVEVYAQDSDEPHVSTGIYSVLWDKWLVKPEKGEKSIDKKRVEKKVNEILDKMEDILYLYKSGEYDKTMLKIQRLKDKIKKMRQAGLDREGEYSYENITFKVLRRMGYLEKIWDLQTKAYDKSLTLDESKRFF